MYRVDILTNLRDISNEICIEYAQKSLPKGGYKSLDVKRIKTIARHAFENLQQLQKKGGAASLKERILVMRELTSSLKLVTTHIHRSKTLWQKLFSLFVNLSDEEKKFNKVTKAAKIILYKLQAKEKKIWTGDSKFLQIINSLGITSSKIAKLYLKFINWILDAKIRDRVARILGKNRIDSEDLEGQLFITAEKYIENDLKKFIQLTNEYLKEEQRKNLYSIQECLKNFQKILFDSFKIEVVKDFESKKKSKINKKKRLKEVAFKLRQQIENLNPGQYMIIPGGYGNKEFGGHAIVYEVFRKENGKYRFTIINTGDGVGNFDNIIMYIYNSVIEKFNDYYITNLDLDKISNEEFLAKITALNNADNGFIGKVFEIIVHYLAKGHKSKIKKGRKHWIQTNGTCTRDSIMCWLESRIDPLIFRAFHLYCIKHGLDYIKKNDKKRRRKPIKAEIDGETYENAELFEQLTWFGKNTLRDRIIDIFKFKGKRLKKIIKKTKKIQNQQNKLYKKIQKKNKEKRISKFIELKSKKEKLHQDQKNIDHMFQAICPAFFE